ncbi:NAD(P)-dependent oxidoreductase [Gallalistipes aquisgranensis]|uniref:NAD(P)-dependent oxidoreductase n=1 Tax=Gallalistipes aquisgranensis TaxID=2779358 RepID=UPI001CF8BDAF|nr:NAD(P)-dependent oxidoreductase [Gallalistipes aquisgranensis]MBE5032949.1 hydroxyacid dehydrogenase [Gallalistipes aquisgranensis]
MNNPLNIVFLDQYTIHNTDLSPIKALGNYTGYDTTPVGQIVERCREADVVIANKTPLKGDTLHALPHLKLICIAATGMNNVDLDTAAQLGITVRNAVGYSTHSVAEQTLCDVLALMKQTLYYDRFVKSGTYSRSDKLFDFGRTTHELHGKNWGIIGMGNIGRRVASLADAFGCVVSYCSVSGIHRPEKYPQKPLGDLLRESDIVSIHAPLSAKTYHLIGSDELKLMKPSALIVNVARGGIVDESALAEALDIGTIAGAGIDVYSSEPLPADNPLLHIEDPNKLILSPHSAWSSEEALVYLIDKVAENISRFIADRTDDQ